MMPLATDRQAECRGCTLDAVRYDRTGAARVCSPSAASQRLRRRRAAPLFPFCTNGGGVLESEGMSKASIGPHCVICGRELTGQDKDRSTCHECRSPKGKIAELWQEVLLHDTHRNRNDDSETNRSWNRLRNLGWVAIRDVARQLFDTDDEGERLLGRIRDRLSPASQKWNELLARPVGELLPLLQAEQAESESEKMNGEMDPPAEPPRTWTKLEWLARAMLIVQEHPEWSDRKIADQVGKHPSTLSRSQVYRASAPLARGTRDSLSDGFRTKDGRIEAPYDPRDLDVDDVDD